MPILYVDTFEMYTEAYEFAKKFNMKTSYDGHYVALARRQGVSLYTADKKLVNIAKPHYSFVRYVDEEEGPAV
jgi:predicted nucleic acid-binding protein